MKVFQHLLSILIILTFFSLLNCTETPSNNPSEAPISLNIEVPFPIQDTTIYIPIDSALMINQIKWWRFSPIHKNRIWVFHYGIPLEINLESLKVYPLKSTIPYDFPNNIRKEHTFFDSLSNSFWFSDNRKNLIRYDFNQEKLFPMTGLGSISAALANKNHICFGFPYGLLLYERARDTLIHIPDLKSVNCQNINMVSDGKININNKYQLDLNTLEIIPIFTDEKFPIKTLKNDSVRLEIVPHLSYPVWKKGSESYQLPIYKVWANHLDLDGSDVWYYRNNSIGRFNIDEGHLIDYKKNKIRDLKMENVAFDKYHIWIYGKNGMHIFDKCMEEYFELRLVEKEYDLKQLIIEGDIIVRICSNQVILNDKYDLLKNLQSISIKISPLEAFNQLLRSLKLYDIEDFPKYLQNINIVYKRFGDHPDKELQKRLKNLSQGISNQIQYSERFQNSTLKFLEDSTLSCRFLVPIYQGLVKAKAKKGLIDDALIFYEKLDGQCSEGRNEVFEKNVEYLKKAKISLDSLHALAIPQDERLWSKGIILEQMLQYDWFLGNYFRDLSLANSEYQQLLNLFPESPFASQAEWKLKKYCGEQDPCGEFKGYLECIEYYKSFIKKYPKSKVLPEVYRAISQHYMYLPCVESEKIWCIKQSIDYLDSLQIYFPNYDDIQSITHKKQYLYREIEKRMWDIQLKAPKRIFTKNEPIILSATLKRKAISSMARRLPVYKTSNNFIVKVKGSKGKKKDNEDLFRQLYQTLEKEFYELTLSPGQVYSETLDITKNVRSRRNYLPGAFFLPKGKYQISVEWGGPNRNFKLRSNVVEIEIIE